MSETTAAAFGSEISGTRSSFRAGGGSESAARACCGAASRGADSRTFATDTDEVGSDSLPPFGIGRICVRPSSSSSSTIDGAGGRMCFFADVRVSPVSARRFFVDFLAGEAMKVVTSSSERDGWKARAGAGFSSNRGCERAGGGTLRRCCEESASEDSPSRASRPGRLLKGSTQPPLG